MSNLTKEIGVEIRFYFVCERNLVGCKEPNRLLSCMYITCIYIITHALSSMPYIVNKNLSVYIIQILND